jgi:hypothetical protein
MRKLWLSLAMLSAFILSFTLLFAQGGTTNFRADLHGTAEVPAVSTAGTGEFHATIQSNETEIAWELEYSGLSGTAKQAHIHFGQPFVAGGIVYWLCGSADFPGPMNTQFCPQGPSGTVKGVAKASDITPVTAQGITGANQFAKVIEAIRQGNAYANIHTDQSKGGEIRGQLRPGGSRNNGDKGNSSGKGRN